MLPKPEDLRDCIEARIEITHQVIDEHPDTFGQSLEGDLTKMNERQSALIGSEAFGLMTTNLFGYVAAKESSQPNGGIVYDVMFNVVHRMQMNAQNEFLDVYRTSMSGAEYETEHFLPEIDADEMDWPKLVKDQHTKFMVVYRWWQQAIVIAESTYVEHGSSVVVAESSPSINGLQGASHSPQS